MPCYDEKEQQLEELASQILKKTVLDISQNEILNVLCRYLAQKRNEKNKKSFPDYSSGTSYLDKAFDDECGGVFVDEFSLFRRSDEMVAVVTWEILLQKRFEPDTEDAWDALFIKFGDDMDAEARSISRSLVSSQILDDIDVIVARLEWFELHMDPINFPSYLAWMMLKYMGRMDVWERLTKDHFAGMGKWDYNRAFQVVVQTAREQKEAVRICYSPQPTFPQQQSDASTCQSDASEASSFQENLPAKRPRGTSNNNSADDDEKCQNHDACGVATTPEWSACAPSSHPTSSNINNNSADEQQFSSEECQNSALSGAASTPEWSARTRSSQPPEIPQTEEKKQDINSMTSTMERPPVIEEKTEEKEQYQPRQFSSCQSKESAEDKQQACQKIRDKIATLMPTVPTNIKFNQIGTRLKGPSRRMMRSRDKKPDDNIMSDVTLHGRLHCRFGWNWGKSVASLPSDTELPYWKVKILNDASKFPRHDPFCHVYCIHERCCNVSGSASHNFSHWLSIPDLLNSKFPSQTKVTLAVALMNYLFDLYKVPGNRNLHILAGLLVCVGDFWRVTATETNNGFEKAVECCKLALEHIGRLHHEDIRILLAKIYAEGKHNPRVAIKIFKECHTDFALFSLAMLYKRMRNWNEALNCFNKAIQSTYNPNSRHWIERAKCLFNLKRVEEARESAIRALNLASEKLDNPRIGRTNDNREQNSYNHALHLLNEWNTY